MPIFFKGGSALKWPGNSPQFITKPPTQKLPGRLDRSGLKPDQVKSAAALISKMAGGSYLAPLPPGIGGGKGRFKFKDGVLLHEGQPFLTCRNIDTAANPAVTPIILISAVFDLNEAWQFPFTGLKSNADPGQPGFSTVKQFRAYADRIGAMVKDHLAGALANIPYLAGREVKVAVGLDFTNKAILAVDVI